MVQDAIAFVLSRYPLRLQPISLVQHLGNAGGSSGARLWRYRAECGELVLRAWPKNGPKLARLELIHSWIQELSALGDVPVPVPFPAIDGRTVQHHDGHFWEVARWLPGTPDLNRPPAAARVQCVFKALASVHRRLSGHALRGTSPGLRQRIGELEKTSESGLDLISAALEPLPADPLAANGRRWVFLARTAIPRLLPALRHAAELHVKLQPCLRDARPEHFLFEHERLSGLIDFGAMGIESVASDLARLIGEWFTDDCSLRTYGLEIYQRANPFDASEFALFTALEATGDLLIAGHWLSWHYLDHMRFDDPGVVGRGVERGLQRLERLLDRTPPLGSY
jgi:homoserine kinase type II